METLPSILFSLLKEGNFRHIKVFLYYSTPSIPAVTTLTEWLKSAAACQGAISPRRERETKCVQVAS
jgi:hypothetical protein